jgi:hypothetical protein
LVVTYKLHIFTKMKYVIRFIKTVIVFCGLVFLILFLLESLFDLNIEFSDETSKAVFWVGILLGILNIGN